MNDENTYGTAIGTAIGTAYDPNTYTYANTTAAQNSLQISNSIVPNHNIVFHGPGGKEVGRFDFNDGDFKFEGDASESAKVFTEWCRRTWNDLRDKDRVEVLQQAIDDMMHEASGELYSEEEKVAILTCMQIAQKIKRKHEGGSQLIDTAYGQNLAKQAPLTPYGVQAQALSAIMPEGTVQEKL